MPTDANRWSMPSLLHNSLNVVASNCFPLSIPISANYIFRKKNLDLFGCDVAQGLDFYLASEVVYGDYKVFFPPSGLGKGPRRPIPYCANGIREVHTPLCSCTHFARHGDLWNEFGMGGKFEPFLLCLPILLARSIRYA